MVTNVENAIPFGDDALILLETGLFKTSNKISYDNESGIFDGVSVAPFDYSKDGTYKEYGWEFRAIYRAMNSRNFLIYTYDFLNEGKFIEPKKIVDSIQSLMNVPEVQDYLFEFLYQPHNIIRLSDGDFEGEVYFSCTNYTEIPMSFEEIMHKEHYSDFEEKSFMQLFLPITDD